MDPGDACDPRVTHTVLGAAVCTLVLQVLPGCPGNPAGEHPLGCEGPAPRGPPVSSARSVARWELTRGTGGAQGNRRKERSTVPSRAPPRGATMAPSHRPRRTLDTQGRAEPSRPQSVVPAVGPLLPRPPTRSEPARERCGAGCLSAVLP